MSSSSELEAIEAQIDEAFADNALVRLPFAQCLWTLLSVVEDRHFKIIVYAPLQPRDLAMYVDGLLNALTYPLRACLQRAPKEPRQVDRKLIDSHYALADKWLDAARDYTQFCSIFPLYRAGEIEIDVRGKELISKDRSAADFSYEAYGRLVAKRDPEQEQFLDANLIRADVAAALRVSGGVYSLDYSRALMVRLHSAFGSASESRHTLPSHWQFASFSLAEYRAVFTCLQVMTYAWFVARQLAAANGVPGMAFASALWTPRKGLLVVTIARHTGLAKQVVETVLCYLTFGAVGIRNPDIAIQPIVDLSNGQYAISPFVLRSVHVERNLCVLLNQIPSERKIYSTLVDQKEKELRSEAIDSLANLGLDFRWGKVTDTDVDLAIIDRKSKLCLCVELKWFIEPAEIREMLARSGEIEKGVTQALRIFQAFQSNDSRLMNLLEVDQSYDFLSMVGSENFIGRKNAQHPDVPITKVWHLIAEIKKWKGLGPVLAWLRSRAYLPRRDVDYKVSEIPIVCGEWRARWYGIGYVEDV